MSIEVFEDHYEHNVDENLIDMKNKISLLLLTLPARYERVIRERIFFNKTLKEIAEDYSVNPERIRQIEASAFRMLKNKIYLKEMQSLIKFHIRKNTK
jgi:RNA polymerase sigma factor (sigma-70 family)|tara:strand:+ start:1071 stop:1364 length:294 start_codon:yes stop_codon:yes gene_type:complete